MAVLAACACFHLAAAAPVVATVTLHGPDALDVSYRIPAACKALPFASFGMKPEVAALVRKDWTPVDDCTAIDFQSIRPRHPACTTLRVRVPATTRARDVRVYNGAHPWAQPFGAGLYAHTAAYAVTDACGPVTWRFMAPGGTVMVDGSVTAQAAQLAHTAPGGLPALLLAQPYDPKAPPLHAEAAVARGTRILLAQILDDSRRTLHAMLPALPLADGYVLAAAGNTAAVRGDSLSPHVMRLLVPPEPVADFRAQARALIAHETAHLAQPDRWRETWHDDLPAIREGGAEFLRLAASVRLGWLTRAQLKDELEAAVNACLLSAGEVPWKSFRARNGGTDAYRCGLTLHLLGFAREAGSPALRRLQDYYRRGGDGMATDFAHSLECADDANCMPQRLERLQSGASLAAVVRDEARSAASLLHAEPAWGPALVEVMVFRHLEQLMRADCKGATTIAHDRTAPRIGPGARCKVLRKDMVLTSAEGLPLFADAAALNASVLACRRTGATVLGLADGDTVTVPCSQTVALPAQVFGIDASRAMALTQ